MSSFRLFVRSLRYLCECEKYCTFQSYSWRFCRVSIEIHLTVESLFIRFGIHDSGLCWFYCFFMRQGGSSIIIQFTKLWSRVRPLPVILLSPQKIPQSFVRWHHFASLRRTFEFLRSHIYTDTTRNYWNGKKPTFWAASFVHMNCLLVQIKRIPPPAGTSIISYP